MPLQEIWKERVFAILQEAEACNDSLSIDTICFLRDNLLHIGAFVKLEVDEQKVSSSLSGDSLCELTALRCSMSVEA